MTFNNATLTDVALHSIDNSFNALDGVGGLVSKVHVRTQQRNGRKCITTVAGLANDLDVKRICKAFKKNFNCSGAIRKIAEDEGDNNFVGAANGDAIQLSGDQRNNVRMFLVDNEICRPEDIVVHGY